MNQRELTESDAIIYGWQRWPMISRSEFDTAIDKLDRNIKVWRTDLRGVASEDGLHRAMQRASQANGYGGNNWNSFSDGVGFFLQRGRAILVLEEFDSFSARSPELAVSAAWKLGQIVEAWSKTTPRAFAAVFEGTWANLPEP